MFPMSSRMVPADLTEILGLLGHGTGPQNYGSSINGPKT